MQHLATVVSEFFCPKHLRAVPEKNGYKSKKREKKLQVTQGRHQPLKQRGTESCPSKL